MYVGYDRLFQNCKHHDPRHGAGVLSLHVVRGQTGPIVKMHKLQKISSIPSHSVGKLRI